jgi:large subunit ribosomal protein L35
MVLVIGVQMTITIYHHESHHSQNTEGENPVPKLKTNRGAAKRFKKTGTGKIKAKRAFARHILTKKPANRKRGLRRPKLIEKADSKGIKKLVPYI